MLSKRHFTKGLLLIWIAAIIIGLRGAGQLMKVMIGDKENLDHANGYDELLKEAGSELSVNPLYHSSIQGKLPVLCVPVCLVL